MTEADATLARRDRPLNHQQLAVVDHTVHHRVTAVAAGAGSGKTETMIACALHLVERGPARLDDFALITFTHKAADELRDRLLLRLRGRTASALWVEQEERLGGLFVGTIHSFCFQVLRAFAGGVVIPRDAGVLMSEGRKRLALFDALEATLELEEEPDSPINDLDLPHHEIERWARTILDQCRTTNMPLSDLRQATIGQPDDREKKYRVAVARLVEEGADRYAKWKDEQGLLDPDDLLLKLASALEAEGGAELAASIGQRYPHVFIDEFQDTDRTQFTIVQHLVPHLRGLLVVGDRKQAIYGWRAADSSLLDDLARAHGIGRPLPLSISMRPTRVLLDVQNAFFGGLADRYPELGEPLEPADGPADVPSPLVPLIYYPTPIREGPETVAHHLRSLIGRALPGTDRTIEPGDVAILARSNKNAEVYASETSRHIQETGWQVIVDKGMSLFTQPAVVATYRMIRLVLEPRHDLSLSLALRTPYLAGPDYSDRERHLLQYGVQDGQPLSDWFESTCPEAATRITELRRAARTDTAPEFLGRLYSLFEIREQLSAAGDFAACDYLEVLRERARSLFASEQALTLPIFADWLAHAILAGRADMDMTGAEVRPPYVRTMTIHRAKGLQFPIVIIPHLTAKVVKSDEGAEFYADEDGLDARIPLVGGGDTRSPRYPQKIERERQARIEEEFRLFYVAVTRAQHQVVLVGGNNSQISGPGGEYYSWRDEVMRLRGVILAAGGQIR